MTAIPKQTQRVVTPSISRYDILKSIGEQFFLMNQWIDMKQFGTAAEYEIAAETLIKVLEVQDCGSIGGFDKGQPSPKNILDRYEWLISKYHSLEDFEKYLERAKEIYRN